MPPLSADLVIVGSGPTGAAYARTVRNEWPEARIMMVEAGPLLREQKGAHLDNIIDDEERLTTEIGAQGGMRTRYAPATDEELAERRAGRLDASMLRRSGLFLSNDADPRDEHHFAGFAAANVGGMGTKWTTGCPRPSLVERPDFIDPTEMEQALARADVLLGVEKDLYPEDEGANRMRARLGAIFDPGRPEDRRVQPMPLASHRRPDGGVERHGIDVILKDMVEESEDRFAIVPDTACMRILHEDGVVSGVLLKDLKTGQTREVRAGTVVVAGDALHSPQLLFASDIRPEALGRYINDHYHLVRHFVTDAEPIASMSWVPRADDWPFSITMASTNPASLPAGVEGNPMLVGIFIAADVTPENRVEFDPGRPDWRGLPGISIKARKTEGDLARIRQAREIVDRIASEVGRLLPGVEVVASPTGTSLHYQGTMRMGPSDDGTSVCDPTGRVWGFENLFVAGNGLIPTMTATNPTLYSVALATFGARAIAEEKRTA